MINRTNSLRALNIILAACAALSAVDCAAGSQKKNNAPTQVGGRRPDWVDGQSSQWPRSAYVTGVGNADDEASAAERARGEVAKVFAVSVNATSTLSESESNSNVNGKTSRSYSNDVAQKVRTVTEKALEGVDIVARWKDTESARYYAFAVLAKDRALLEVHQKAAEIDSEAAQQKALFGQAADAFGRAKAAAKLLALAKARESLAADSRVLGGGELPGDFDGGAIKAQAAQALAALNVAVSVTGEGAEAVQTAVVSGLNAAGLSAKSASEGADLSASAQVAVEEQSASDPRWKRRRASATVSLQDARAGKVFANFDVSDREESVDPGEARRRALATLSKNVAAKVTAAINDYFTNQ